MWRAIFYSWTRQQTIRSSTLKALLQRREIDTSSFVEKSELVAALREADAAERGAEQGESDDEDFHSAEEEPPEPAVRAVSTLAQKAGVERIQAARAVAAEQIRKKLKKSRQLVDHASDGNVEKMEEELNTWLAQWPPSVSQTRIR